MKVFKLVLTGFFLAALCGVAVAETVAVETTVPVESSERTMNDLLKQASERREVDREATKFRLVTTSPSPWRGSGPPSILVVRSSDEPVDGPAIVEDVMVMSRLLSRKLKGRPGADRMRPAFTTGTTLVGSYLSFRDMLFDGLYIQGYGVILAARADFRLLPPPQTEQIQEPESDVDTAWEAASRSLAEPEPTTERRQLPVAITRAMLIERDVEYDAEKVKGLKRELLDSIKHATNFSGMGANDRVTILVIGMAPRGRQKPSRMGGWPLHHGLSAGVEATLTISVTKGDLDAFAAGGLSQDEFRQKVFVEIR